MTKGDNIQMDKCITIMNERQRPIPCVSLDTQRITTFHHLVIDTASMPTFSDSHGIEESWSLYYVVCQYIYHQCYHYHLLVRIHIQTNNNPLHNAVGATYGFRVVNHPC